MKASDWQMPRLPAPPATPDLEMWAERLKDLGFKVRDLGFGV